MVVCIELACLNTFLDNVLRHKQSIAGITSTIVIAVVNENYGIVICRHPDLQDSFFRKKLETFVPTVGSPFVGSALKV